MLEVYWIELLRMPSFFFFSPSQTSSNVVSPYILSMLSWRASSLTLDSFMYAEIYWFSAGEDQTRRTDRCDASFFFFIHMRGKCRAFHFRQLPCICFPHFLSFSSICILKRRKVIWILRFLLQCVLYVLKYMLFAGNYGFSLICLLYFEKVLIYWLWNAGNLFACRWLIKSTRDKHFAQIFFQLNVHTKIFIT